jgi:hypothetical protein
MKSLLSTHHKEVIFRKLVSLFYSLQTAESVMFQKRSGDFALTWIIFKSYELGHSLNACCCCFKLCTFLLVPEIYRRCSVETLYIMFMLSVF